MAIKVAGITKEEFDQNSRWVVKFTDRPRIVDTYPNLEKILGKSFYSDDNVRDVDLVCYEGQPDIVKPFITRMHEIDREHGWMTIPEIFDKFGVESDESVTVPVAT